MNNQGQFWTKDEERTLAKANAAGLTRQQAADMLGRPIGGIKHKARALGLCFPRNAGDRSGRENAYSASEDAVLIAFAKAGKTQLDVAEAIGRSLHSVKSRSRYIAVSFGGKGSKSFLPKVERPMREPEPEPSEPQITDDEAHVEAVMAEGGFPRAEQINGRTVWIYPKRQRLAA